MRTFSFTRKKLSSETLSPEIVAQVQALAGADVEVGMKAAPPGDDDLGMKPVDLGATKDVEPSSQSRLKVTTPPLSSNETSTSTSKVSISSSPMNRLRRMMRSQSDGGIIISGLSLVPIIATPSPSASVIAMTSGEQTGQSGEPPSGVLPSLDPKHGPDASDIQATSTPRSNTISEPPTLYKDEDSGDSSAAATSATAAACDVFLNASIQLLHSQSDARQRVRQLWLTIQRLRYENQLSDTGVELLHTELLAIMKSFNMEKLDGARHLKTGYLTLVQAPDMVNSRPPLMAKSLFGGGIGGGGGAVTRPVLGQRMWCTLSEEYGKFEMTPVRGDRESGQYASPSSMGGMSSSSPLAGLSNKLKLPTSLSSLLADAFQQAMPLAPSGNPEPARAIKLHGCQVHKVPVTAVKAAETGIFPSLNGATTPSAAAGNKKHHQIQILVPNTRSSVEHVYPSSSSMQTSYNVYAFEVAESDGGEQECEAWTAALDRVCMFHLYMLERSIRDVRSVEKYRHVLSSHLPLCISLSWLRNRIDRYDNRLHGSNHSGQQQVLFQHQQQQRRSSKNLSMVQIIKDLERDKVLVDQKLITTTTNNSSSTDSSTDGNNGEGSRSEQGNISEVVKYVVMKVMEFVKKAEQRAKTERTTTIHSYAPVADFRSLQLGSAEPRAKESTTSPTNRFIKYSEAKALAFVERVLRGSSRTQSGGDIYDAISFFCQHSRVSICPVSQDACPVQMNIVSDDTCELFQVEIQVCMRFKVIEMTPMTTTTTSSTVFTPSPSMPVSTTPPESSTIVNDNSSTFSSASDVFFENTGYSIADHLTLEGPKEWAVLEGTLSRQFTLGRLSEPGTVTINFIPQESSSSSCS